MRCSVLFARVDRARMRKQNGVILAAAQLCAELPDRFQIVLRYAVLTSRLLSYRCHAHATYEHPDDDKRAELFRQSGWRQQSENILPSSMCEKYHLSCTMGIEGLAKYVRKQVGEKCIRTTTLNAYAGQVFAVDASNPLTAMVKLGMNPVHGLRRYVEKLVRCGITPVFVFDGATRAAKGETHRKRRKRRDEMRGTLQSLRKRMKLTTIGNGGDNMAQVFRASKKIQTLEKSLATLTWAHVAQCKKLLKAMGVPFIQAPDEADNVCAALFHAKRIDGCITNDSDFFARGVGLVLMQVKCGGTSLDTMAYSLPDMLTALKLTAAEFVDMCILMGCDYTGRIQQIGPARAHRFMQKYHSIEAILEQVCDVQKPFVTPPKAIFDQVLARRELQHWTTLLKANDYAIDIHLQPFDDDKPFAQVLTQYASYVPRRCPAAIASWRKARQSWTHVTKPRCTLTEKEGDLFDDTQSALAHCVSADLHMGAGIAVAFKTRFGQVDKLRAQQPAVGKCLVLSEESQRCLFYLVTKPRYFDKPTYDTLRQALVDLREQCATHNVTALSIPRIGCGLDKLAWPRVKAMLATVFKRTLITITVYTLAP